MTHWWLASWRRGAKRTRSLRVLLHLEALEERNLLSSLVSVPSPQIPAQLVGAAAISASDIWATGSVGIENWNGTSWSLVSATPGVGVAALSDGTVVVVSGNSILEN